jgi:hypothetical protein
LGISNKKIYRAEDGIDETMVCSDGIPVVPRNSKLSEFRFPNHSAKEKKCSEFCSVGQKYVEANFQSFVPQHLAEENMLSAKVIVALFEFLTTLPFLPVFLLVDSISKLSVTSHTQSVRVLIDSNSN